MTLENIWVRVSIERIALYSNVAEKDVFVQNELAGYRLVEALHPKDGAEEGSHEKQQGRNYRLLLLFEHLKTNNKLRIYIQRRKKAQLVPTLYLVFDSSYLNPLKYEEVLFVQNHFERNHDLGFGVWEVHVATDLLTGTGNGLLHPIICSWIRARNKGRPSKMDADGTLIFGSPQSDTQLIVYDKAEQLLRTEGIKLSEEVSRIETRIISPRADIGFVNTIDSVHTWSRLYGEYFSFHKPRGRLREVLGNDTFALAIWELEDLMSKEHGVTASKFYRDYVKDYRKLSKPVRKALAEYRW